MAQFQELEDRITVTVNTPSVNFPSHPIIAPVIEDLNRKVSKVKALKPIVGSRVANRARLNQMSSINAMDAICSGALYNSIRVNGSGGEYTVGTSSSKKGYYYLIHGRGAINLKGQLRPDGRPRVMVYPYKCYGQTIITPMVGPAAPKNYMAESKPKTEADIKTIVEEEVKNAMS